MDLFGAFAGLALIVLAFGLCIHGGITITINHKEK